MVFDIAIYTIFFDLWGCPTGYSCSSKYQRFACAMQFVHSLVALFLTYQMIYLVAYLYGIFGLLGAINDASQCLCLLFTYWTILIESFANRKAKRLFWKYYFQLNNGRRVNGKLLNPFEPFILSIYYILIMAVEINLLGVPLYILSLYCILYSIVQIRVLYHVFCLRLIAAELNFIAAELNFIEDELKKVLHSMSDIGDNIRQMLKEIRRKHQIIKRLVDQTNSNLSLSSAAAMLSQFYLIYANTNWLFIQDDIDLMWPGKFLLKRMQSTLSSNVIEHFQDILFGYNTRCV